MVLANVDCQAEIVFFRNHTPICPRDPISTAYNSESGGDQFFDGNFKCQIHIGF